MVGVTELRFTGKPSMLRLFATSVRPDILCLPSPPSPHQSLTWHFLSPSDYVVDVDFESADISTSKSLVLASDAILVPSGAKKMVSSEGSLSML